jgi:hypothetical protein
VLDYWADGRVSLMAYSASKSIGKVDAGSYVVLW